MLRVVQKVKRSPGRLEQRLIWHRRPESTSRACSNCNTPLLNRPAGLAGAKPEGTTFSQLTTLRETAIPAARGGGALRGLAGRWEMGLLGRPAFLRGRCFIRLGSNPTRNRIDWPWVHGPETPPRGLVSVRGCPGGVHHRRLIAQPLESSAPSAADGRQRPRGTPSLRPRPPPRYRLRLHPLPSGSTHGSVLRAGGLSD